MKLQFSASQDYQLKAVQSVVSLFEGQPLAQGEFDVSFDMQQGNSIVYTEKAVANNLVLSEASILQNLQNVQIANELKPSDKLAIAMADDKKTELSRLNFTIEMETGTGKTYTFLRTIYELNKVYGFKKFVIVVPSVAIREGTIKNLEITKTHFQNLYQSPPTHYIMYDSKNISNLRNFAVSNAIEILVINIDSFTGDSNVINTTREIGLRPIEYLQRTQPIVIIDEPQNFETDTRKKAIQSLNPLCTLRYSATHKNFYNLIYSLNPAQAYDLGLVKQIEVDGVTADDTENQNTAFVELLKIKPTKLKQTKFQLAIYAQGLHGLHKKEIWAELLDDLYQLSNGREIYQNGFILSNFADESLIFSNGLVLKVGQRIGDASQAIMKTQIAETIKWHFQKVAKLKDKGIKVLSLFFIDKVANYRDYEAADSKGKFAIWFEEEFKKYQAKNPNLIPYEAAQVHNGYFSSDKTGKAKDKKEIWTDTKGTTAKDDDTYALIMKDKERLLSIEEPLQFIFSHSALREGWDNPNVFQICTLNESKSELKKRQEIGRGLRLSVNSEGQRIHDKNINVLTVIANENYETFAEELQKEVEEETSVQFKGRIKNAREKVTIRKNKELTLENFPLLFEIWEKISQKTRYSVEFSTTDLIKAAVQRIQEKPMIKAAKILSKKAKIEYKSEGITTELLSESPMAYTSEKYQIPNVYAYIQNRVNVTRATIYEVLTQSGKLKELEINPQLFLDNVVDSLRESLQVLLVQNIKYHQLNGQQYEMRLFDLEEIETYLSNLFKVNDEKAEKTIFNYIPIDSQTESQFAIDCQANEQVKFFFKLPRGFKIPTPLGNYTPDWALIMENDSRVYFVAETKSTTDTNLLRAVEKLKIDCGRKHFAILDQVNYKVVTKLEDLS